MSRVSQTTIPKVEAEGTFLISLRLFVSCVTKLDRWPCDVITSLISLF